jgi:dihydrofolate synthase/folylpolyglutamate synthase
MTYLEAVDVLFTKLPMFQRSGPAAYKANLDGTRAVCKLLENPENDLKFIHIAGTNGKGTVSHMVAAVLQKAGYKTGLFTSPHLVDFRERIRLNGEKIPESKVFDFVDKYSDTWGEPSFFELTFGMALQYFKDEC